MHAAPSAMHAPLFHYQPSFTNLHPSGTNFQQLQFGSTGCQEVSIPPQQVTSHLRQSNPMAQAIPSQQSQLQSQPWQRHQTYPHEYNSAKSSHPDFEMNDTLCQRNLIWGHNAALNSSLSLVPGILRDPNGSSCNNKRILYPEAASQGFVEDGNFKYGGQPPWPTPSSSGFPCDTSVVESDPESNHSLSPKSSRVPPFTPEPADRIPKSINWDLFSLSAYPAVKTSSPDHATQGFSEVPHVDFPNMPQANLSITGPPHTPIGNSHRFNGLPNSGNSVRQYASEYGFSQKSNLGASAWYLPNNSQSPTDMPIKLDNPSLEGLSNTYQTNSDNSDKTANEGISWNDSHCETAAQGRCHDHRHFLHVDPQGRRKADDDILLEGKRDGLTYKEIRRRMHAKCAESTLRGRYRSLTKARKDRVRKPVWRDIDIRLLQQFVQRDLIRIDANHHPPLKNDQRLAKVQWKRVADAIHANGGSYHFGNSTCKRKWVELNPNS